MEIAWITQALYKFQFNFEALAFFVHHNLKHVTRTFRSRMNAILLFLVLEMTFTEWIQ